AAPTEAAAFHPTADEIAAVAVRHFAAGGTLVSFGRACEGEPLLAARLLEAALEMIRARTATGTLHVETNGSSPAALRRLIAAGLTRRSCASERSSVHSRAYRWSCVTSSRPTVLLRPAAPGRSSSVRRSRADRPEGWRRRSRCDLVPPRGPRAARRPRWRRRRSRRRRRPSCRSRARDARRSSLHQGDQGRAWTVGWRTEQDPSL